MELKREVKDKTIQIVDDVLANTERRVSSWAKLKRCCCARKNPADKNQLNMVLIQKAEHQIIRVSQRRHLSDEIKLMERNKCVKKSSSIYKLDLYIDGNGLLRVGGRLNQSTMDESVKHPILIPKASILARLIIKWCHGKVAHYGRGITKNQIRSSGFWMTNFNVTVKSFI